MKLFEDDDIFGEIISKDISKDVERFQQIMGNKSNAKLSKEEVKFESPAKGPEKCKDCIHFLYVSCDIVAGHIGPRDWCNQFSPK